MRPLQKTPRARIPGDAKGVLRVIVKTRAAGYVPEGANLRTRIDETMFTADVAASQLSAMENDPEVHSIQVATEVRPID